MGDYDLATCRWLADAIADCIKGKSVLVVASSDLSHYHSYDMATEMDHRLLDKVGAMDTEDVSDCLNSGKCEACGRGPIITAMLIAKRLGSAKCDVVHYANSGDVTGDKYSPKGVVGYAAACFSIAPHDKDRADSQKKEVRYRFWSERVRTHRTSCYRKIIYRGFVPGHFRSLK